MLLAATGCNNPNTIHVVYSADEQKVILNPHQGDVVQWATPAGAPVTVHFFPPGGTPCKEGANPVGTCTIAVAKGRALYTCDKCSDPEVVVGSDLGTMRAPTEMVKAPPTAKRYIACESSQIVMYDPEGHSTTDISIPAGATNGGSILWVGLGNPPLSDWKADSFSTAVCSNAPPFQPGNATCNLLALPAGTTTNYSVSAPSCSSTPLPARITITP